MLKISSLILINLFFILPACLAPVPIRYEKVIIKESAIIPDSPIASQNNSSSSVNTSTPAQNTSVAIKSLNANKIEKLIWEKTNQERQKFGLNRLEYEDKIAEIARAHSANMAENNFFEHTDLQGLDHGDRISRGYPSLFTSGSAENIAYNFGDTEEEAALNLVTAWMNSEGHRRNILNSKMTYLGVGVYIKGERIYGTQNFVTPVINLETDLSSPREYGKTSSVSFKFYNGVINKNDLTVFVKFPDTQSKFYLPDNSYFTGRGKYYPQWLDDNRFSFSLTLDRGIGDYEIRICEDNYCYDTSFKIKVN
ncbi:MAG: CAP domain-containing protein [Candidatus Sericytochromatia bacterium]